MTTHAIIRPSFISAPSSIEYRDGIIVRQILAGQAAFHMDVLIFTSFCYRRISMTCIPPFVLSHTEVDQAYPQGNDSACHMSAR